MKTLAQYLAEYLEQEIVMCPNDGKTTVPPLDIEDIHELVEQGIDAYQSTENCTIGICGGDCPDCGTLMQKGVAVLYAGSDDIDVVSYQCLECGYIVYG